jgi:hypothetical protein
LRCVLPLDARFSYRVTAVLLKVQRRFIEVMRAAPQLDVAHRRGAACGIGLDVMELQESGLSASAR